MEFEPTNAPWQRVHPISLLFVLIAKLRQWIIPIVFGLFSAQQGSLIAIGLGAVAFAILLAFTITRYLTLRFRLANGELQVRDGIFFRSNRTVPVNRIQNVDLVQNILHRIFRVAEVRIETASGKEPEAILQVLALSKVEELRASIFAEANAIADAKQKSRSVTVTEEDAAGVESTTGNDGTVVPSAPQPPERPQRLLLAISLKQLALAGLTSNRGLLLVPIALGTLYETRTMSRGFRDQFRINSNDILSRLPQGVSTLQIVIWFLVGSLTLFLMLKLFSVAWFVIRFYGYQLHELGDDLRISCGLLTKVSATVPRSRIQFISIHRSWLGRRMGLAAIRIETAGGGGTEHENASQSVARRWFAPAIWESQVVVLMENLRPEIRWTESQFDWQPLSSRTAKRLRRMGIVATVVLTLIAAFVWQFWGAAVGIILLPLSFWFASRLSKSMRYARNGSLIVYRSGLMTRKCSCAFVDKIQSLRLSQSPFDRRWKMATLAVDTAAAGPAEHKIVVKYLDANFAQSEFSKLKNCVGVG